MTFASVSSILRGWLAIVLLSCCAAATAATINFNGGNASGCTLNGSTYSCSSLPNVNDTDVISIANGYTVVVSSAVSFSYNQGLKMSGTAKLQTSGNLNIGDINPANLSITGGTLTTGGNFKIGNQAQTITANVNAATMTVGTGSATKITGTLTATGEVDLGSHATIVGPIVASVITSNSPVSISGNVSATTSFQLASGSQLSGTLFSPQVTLDSSGVTVTGNITAATSLTIGSGNTVNGTVTGGTLSLASSNVVINGDVNMTGDISIGASDTINGNLTGHNVTTHASGDYISGNAQVNAIYLDWGATVGKVITCTGAPAGAPDCVCVTRADSNYHPTCASSPPPPSLPDHFQITHGGSALTCQPQTVTITACANASCSTLYTSPVTVTTFPGGQQFNVTGGVNTSATVQQSQAGTTALSATGATNTNTCVNTGNPSSSSPCNMQFTDNGFVVTATSHVSMKSYPANNSPKVTLQALKQSPTPPYTCVPLVANKNLNVNMSCAYSNPDHSNAALPVILGGTSVACKAGQSTSIPFNFDANGSASTTLQYADVGQVSVTASYTASNLGASGTGSFITAPDKFQLIVTNASGQTIGPQQLSVDTANPLNTGAFAKASEPLAIKVSALNAAGNVTPNYGQEQSPEGVNITLNVLVPNQTAGSSLTVGTYSAFANGSSTVTANYDNVGIINLTPKVSNNTGYYLGYMNGGTAFQPTGTQNVGRFIPDHFDTVLMTDSEVKALNPSASAGNMMSCGALATGLSPCDGNSTIFVNSAQPIFLKVTAYNGATPPAVTTFYENTLTKTITLSALTTKGGSTASNGTVYSSTSDTAPPAPYSFAQGIGMPANAGATNTNLPVFKFTTTGTLPAPVGSGVLPATIYLRAIDQDGASSRRSIPANSVEAALAIVSGRLMVSNNYGSLTSPLPVKAYAQYLLSSGYVSNPLLNTTSAGAVSSAISFSYCQKALDLGGNSCPGTLNVNNSNALQLINGTGSLLLAAPTPTLSDKGSVDVTLKAPGTNGAQLIPYLPSATGRETFGIYRSGPVIYTREVH